MFEEPSGLTALAKDKQAKEKQVTSGARRSEIPLEASSPMAPPPRRKQLGIGRSSTPTGGGSGGGDAGTAANLTQDQLEQVGFSAYFRVFGFEMMA